MSYTDLSLVREGEIIYKSETFMIIASRGETYGAFILLYKENGNMDDDYITDINKEVLIGATRYGDDWSVVPQKIPQQLFTE